MVEIDNSTHWIASIFVLAFIVHILHENIPTTVDVWPAKPSDSWIMGAMVYDNSSSPTTTTTTTMSASSLLRFEERYPRPMIRPDQVLIQVHYSSLNPCDFKFRRNSVPNILLPKPKIPGEDISGVVVQLGSKIEYACQENDNKINNIHDCSIMNPNKIQLGDRVAAMMPALGARWGALAEYAAVDAALVAKLRGTHTTLQQAAALPLVGLTTVQAFAKLKPNHQQTQSILIQAGAGGVGSFAIQYAKNVLHMDQVATTASSGKAELVKKLGADVVIDYHGEHFEQVIQGYDAVFDTMSWAYETRTMQSGVLKGRGHYLNILSSDWIHDGRERTNGIHTLWNFLYSKIRNALLTGHVPKYDIIAVNPNGIQLQEILDLVENGTITPVIDRTFSWKDANAAFAYLEQGRATGKVVLDHESTTV